MNKIITMLFVCGFILLNSCTNSKSRILFNGNDSDNNNWQTDGSVSMDNSILKLSGRGSRVVLREGDYKDFDLNVVLRTVRNGKGFIGFHTDDSGKKGYRIAINNDVTDPVWWKMTGSLLSVRNLTKSMIKDEQWLNLKKQFGNDLIFHGGIENQKTLPMGTVQDVIEETRKCMETLGENGGYICCSCHNAQAGTPVENILAMIDTVKNYKI